MKLSPAVLLILSVFLSSCVGRPITSSEKKIFLTAGDYAEVGFLLPESYEKNESWDKTMYFDGTFDLEYEYETEDEESDITYLSVSYTYERKYSDMIIQKTIIEKTFNLMYSAGGLNLKPIPFENSYDGQFFIIENSYSNAVGNVIILSKGNTLFSMSLVGGYFSEAEDWFELAGESLEEGFSMRLGLFSLTNG